MQHVLKMGKSHARSQIIKSFAGAVVRMSFHKYASNVVEKCLEHGDTTERELLIGEIIGQSEDSDDLLVRSIFLLFLNLKPYMKLIKFILSVTSCT